MSYLTLNEINSNEKYAPIGYEKQFKQRIIKDTCMNELNSFFSNPFLLKSKIIEDSTTELGRFKVEEQRWKNNTNFYDGQHLELEDFKYNKISTSDFKIVIDHLRKKIKKSDIWNFQDERELKYIPRVELLYKYVDKKTNEMEITYKLTGSLIVPKYTLLKDFKGGRNNLKPSNFKFERNLESCIRAFNIIQKCFKVMDSSKLEYYSRWFNMKPFQQFEENGFEILYARKGYSIDGKRLPSFNRGSCYGLKRSLKINNIKQKGLTKKDDMIRALMKI